MGRLGRLILAAGVAWVALGPAMTFLYWAEFAADPAMWAYVHDYVDGGGFWVRTGDARDAHTPVFDFIASGVGTLARGLLVAVTGMAVHRIFNPVKGD